MNRDTIHAADSVLGIHEPSGGDREPVDISDEGRSSVWEDGLHHNTWLESGGMNSPSRTPPNDERQSDVTANTRSVGQQDPTTVNGGRAQSMHKLQNVASSSTALQGESELHESVSQTSDQTQEGVTQTPRRARRAKKKLSRRAAIQIASLNINGFGTTSTHLNSNKWNHINQVLREKKIAILLVQETHMTEDRRVQVENLFSRRMKIIASADPDNPTAKAGVAIVLNKQLLGNSPVTATVIVPGRALLIQTSWLPGRPITILAVYAPNIHGNGLENTEFWNSIKSFYEQHPQTPKPDIMAGDCNVVEDRIDRFPERADPIQATDALSNLKTFLSLYDGWRHENPNMKMFTYHHIGTGVASRLDRIYAQEEHLTQAREWKSIEVGINGLDHNMVSVRLACEDSPLIGKGRWTIPDHVVKDKKLAKNMKTRGQDALAKLEALAGSRTAEVNPQKILYEFKTSVLKEARQRQKDITVSMTRQTSSLQSRRDRLINDETVDTEEKKIQLAHLTEALMSLEKSRHAKARSSVATRNRLEGETICKYWTSINKESKPCDVIYSLREPESTTGAPQPQYEKHSGKMANLARNYHESLQYHDETNREPDINRQREIKQVLDNLQRKLTADQEAMLKEITPRENFEMALKFSRTDSAAGLDGATYNLWKTLHARFLEDERNKRPSFDVLKLMVAAFQDIEEHGVDTTIPFSQGWMCPIYKKGDQDNIANYCPITLLNTDYKLFTKGLNIKLVEVAPHLLHKSQAGFVPGRSIVEQTKLIRAIMNYAEVVEKDGYIVALDQEKAYDKIAHDYLWETLQTFGFPAFFTNTIKSLYHNAETSVMINGLLSKPYRVTRGVRQGDPISCLLFDLAIEPLAAMLHNSPLQGYSIPGNEERILELLFADDTTVFLDKEDDFGDLRTILEVWCKVSTAKFNITKTLIIPIGKKEFRQQLIHSRRPNANVNPIPNNINIVKEGEAVRILGAWYGNGTGLDAPWSHTMDKINMSLDRWEKSRPTIAGRRLITQMVVGGMTQYLTQVQTMPTKVETLLAKRIRTFMWADKTQSPVNEDTLHMPIERGGQEVLDLQARNQAIDVMWLKSYLKLTPERPMWATVADAILAHLAPKNDPTPYETKINYFLQHWATLTSCLPPDLQRLLKTAKQFGLRAEGRAFPRDVIRDRPIWNHNDATSQLKRLHSSTTGKCLRMNHKVQTVGDTEILAHKLSFISHKRKRSCRCRSCRRLRTQTGCKDPNACYELARKLLDTLPPKWNPLSLQPEDYQVEPPGGDGTEFDRRITDGESLADVFRIFTSGNVCNNLPTRPDHPSHATKTIAATDGSCLNNGYDNAQAGAGIYFGADDARNMTIRLPKSIPQSNQTGELTAVKELLEANPTDDELTNETDSKYVIKLLMTSRKKLEDNGFIKIPN